MCTSNRFCKKSLFMAAGIVINEVWLTLVLVHTIYEHM